MRDTPKQENVIITAKELKRLIARMSNWKAAGPDNVEGFVFKKVTSLPQTQTTSTRVCECWGAVPTWMTEGRTVLIKKDKSKGTDVGN